MSAVKISYRPCPRHKYCGQVIPERSSVRYCSICERKLLAWVEKNPALDALSNKDVFFIFEHPEGCTKSDLSLCLGISEERLGAFQKFTGLSNEFDPKLMVKAIRVVHGLAKLDRTCMRDHLAFIKDHLTGCFAKELYSYLGISRVTFNVYLRTGKVILERKWRVGKEVFKWIGFKEMLRIIGLKKGWISLYQVAKAKNKRYYTLQHYANDGYFDKLGTNLEGLLSIQCSVLSNFEDRWEKAAEDHKESKLQGKRRLLAADEVHLGIIVEWLCTSSEGHLWLFFDNGWLKGESRNGMSVVKVTDLKKFLLAVAGGVYPVQRSLLGDWENSPLGKDRAFSEKMHELLQKDIPNEDQPLGNGSVKAEPGELTIKQVADIFSSKVGTVYWWFSRKTIANTKKDGLYRTTLADVKQLIQKILRDECGIAKSAAQKALAHPLIYQDQAFVQEMKELI